MLQSRASEQSFTQCFTQCFTPGGDSGGICDGGDGEPDNAASNLLTSLVLLILLSPNDDALGGGAGNFESAGFIAIGFVDFLLKLPTTTIPSLLLFFLSVFFALDFLLVPLLLFIISFDAAFIVFVFESNAKTCSVAGEVCELFIKILLFEFDVFNDGFIFLVRVVQVLGREAALNLYTETKELESKGEGFKD